MLIVDSQVHIWGANTPERPWPARAHAQREIPLGHEQLLKDMDGAGIDRVIIVPPSWDCLLYTSPSPRDRQKSRMPSSA